MRRDNLVGLWWAPLLLVVAPIMGMVPAHRDLIDFFLPMRSLTAELIAAGAGPWINFANGCAEAWFANPETAVLYPPGWVHLVLPGPWALTVEIALHLSLTSLGVGLLARDLGAGRSGRLLAEVSAWSAGPILFTVGVLNNLETLTWLPWMVLAARLEDRRSVPLMAAATALGWLGGEPQIWAMGVVLAIATSRRRGRAMIGVGLGVAIVAVQLVPFLVWVAEGDRGPTAVGLLRGALTPADWSGLLTPSLAPHAGRMVYAESLFLGAPMVLCALLGARRWRWPLVTVVALILLASLPEIGAGKLFIILTGGLVRYPSRFALVGLALLLPFVGRGADEWLEGRGKWSAVVLSVLTLGLCVVTTHPLRWWVSAVPALVMLGSAFSPERRTFRAVVLVVGAAAMVVAGLPLLGLRPVTEVATAGAVWPEAAGSGRVYVPTPSDDVMPWLATGLETRRLWPVGYLNLADGLTLVRTDAPVSNARLAAHVAIADEGPTRRWWLDTLGAEWIILPAGGGLPEDMEEIASRGGMRLLRNHDALPVVSLEAGKPDPEESAVGVGQIEEQELSANRCTASFETTTDAWLWISLTPVTGWRWRLDGSPVELEQGSGIVQFLEVAPGHHRLEGRYMPPMHLLTTILSGCAFLAVMAGWARCWKQCETR